MITSNVRPTAHKLQMSPSCLENNSTLKIVISGFSNAQVGKSGNPDSDLATVFCGPLSLYLEALGLSHVDFFSLDVESHEFDVIQTIDFSRVTFNVIIAENNGPGVTSEEKPSFEARLAKIDSIMSRAGKLPRSSHLNLLFLFILNFFKWLISI